MNVPDWYTAGATWTFLVFAGPALAACLILGVAGAILQTTTQVREAALGFVPKVAGLLILVTFGGGMMMHYADGFTAHVFRAIPDIIHADSNR